MAGRGTDIKLGGRDERSRDQVVAAGGLYVIGTGRFESRRVDYQLRGRAGRQGDPGASRFFVSLEDPLMRRFKVERWIPKGKRRRRQPSPVEDAVVHEKIALVQRIAEGQSFEIRRTLFNYTSFIEKQRRCVQEERDRWLRGAAESRLAERCPERYGALLEQVGPEILRNVEAKLLLFHLDRAWSGHLADIADLREGIYLRRLGGQSPLGEFIKAASEIFDEMQREVDDRVAETFAAVEVTPEGIDVEKEGLKGPSSTWTYLINDNPFQWMGSLSDMGTAGFGIATGLYFGFVFALQSLYRKIVRRP
jgi:preprotein translocase subunit SecA